MKYKEYKNKNKPVFVYIHGECLSTFCFKTELKELKKDYTVLLPVISGHGDDYNTEFVSIEDCATNILNFINLYYDGHVQVLSGFGLGAQIATTMLSMQPDLCEYAMLESPLMKPMKLKSWSDYTAMYAPALAKNKFYNSFMYYTKFNDDYALDDYYRNYKNMTKENMKTILKAVYSYNIPNLSKVTAKVALLLGQRESKIYKTSANMIHEQIENSNIYMLMNYTHGDFSLGHPEEFVRFVKSWIQKKDRVIQKKKKQIEESQEYLPNYKHLINKWKNRQAIKNAKC